MMETPFRRGSLMQLARSTGSHSNSVLLETQPNRNTSLNLSSTVVAASNSKPPLPRSASFNSSRFKARSGSIFEDSRVLNTSALRFTEAEAFQKDAVSSIVDRIKNRSKISSASQDQMSSLDHSRAAKTTSNVENEKNQRKQIEHTRELLRNLNNQLEDLSTKTNINSNDQLNADDQKNIEEYRARKSKQWDELREKIEMEKQRKKCLENISDVEKRELELLESEYEEIKRDLERAEKIKEYLAEQKRGLWMLQRFHQKDRGTLVSQNVRLDRVFVESRALRQKELGRIKSNPEEGCEDIILDGRALQMKKKIEQMQLQNATLRKQLEHRSKKR